MRNPNPSGGAEQKHGRESCDALIFPLADLVQNQIATTFRPALHGVIVVRKGQIGIIEYSEVKRLLARVKAEYDQFIILERELEVKGSWKVKRFYVGIK